METLKKYGLYVVSALAFIAGFIYYLIGKNRGLEEKLNQSEAEKALAATLAKKELIDEKANNAVSAYESARDAYRKSRDSNV